LRHPLLSTTANLEAKSVRARFQSAIKGGTKQGADKPHFNKRMPAAPVSCWRSHGYVCLLFPLLLAAGAAWPQDRPNFLRFVLYKENKDTMDAINGLSRRMGVNSKVDRLDFPLSPLMCLRG
jgi:hypothetical protein